MIPPRFDCVEDVYVVARQLRDKLTERGEVRAAAEIDEAITTFWTTASEALGEINVSLTRVRPIVKSAVGAEAVDLLDSAVNGATKLWNG